VLNRRFIRRDIFTSVPTKDNRLAVVVDGDELLDGEMQAFATWTNLAETTFLMPPTTAEADYKVRIFVPR
jgi:PhzF family phenazine biosynthesis protein